MRGSRDDRRLSPATHTLERRLAMARPSLPVFVSLHAVLLLALWITFGAVLAQAQNYCGPVTVVNFNGTNGQYPAAGVTFDGLGNMYGTTAQGGPTFNPIGNQGILNYGLGTIWKYSPSSGLTQLFAFSGQTSPSNNGYRPETPLVRDAQGNLYGTTYYGGNDFSPNVNNHFGWGTLFEYSAAGQFTELYQFSGPDGANPVGAILDSKENLWGTTWQGGLGWNQTLGNFGLGTIFEYSSGTLTNPVLFSSSNGGGNTDGGLAADGQGNYYGTTYEGGANGFGSLFQYSSSTGQLTTLFNFDRNPHGSLPAATVTLDGKGNIYGTTYQGGSHSSASNYCCGTVWKYSLSSGTMTTPVSFDGDTVPADGMFPGGGVTLDSSGNVYGTTIQGGSNGDGIVFEYSASGVLSTLVTFSGPNGWSPEGNLVFDSNNNLWGITNQGGSSGYGTVYKLTPNTGGGTCSGLSLSSLTLNPTTIANGGTSTGTVTLSPPAPPGGSVVGLSSNSSFIIVPSNVTVPAGATSASFAVNTNGFVLSNTSVVITAAIGNSTQQATLTLTPGIAVSSLSLNPTTVSGGSNSTATVTIASPAPSGGSEVLISKSQNPPCPPPLILPNAVTVPAGSTSTNFTVGTTTVSSSCAAQVFAQSGGTTVSATLTVNPGGSSGPTVSSVTLNPANVQGGSNSQGTVTLSAVAPSGGTVVSLSSNSSSASVANTVTVPAGSTSASFTVTTKSVTSTATAVITATFGSSSQQASLTITPATSVTLSSLTLNPTSVSGGTSSTGTVKLTAAAPSSGATVTLSSSNTSVATVPSSVTVQAGQTSTSFSVRTQRVSSSNSVVISATYNGTTKNATLTVRRRD
jgi:uncharacterized repeat protein (TIGR03803 family)